MLRGTGALSSHERPPTRRRVARALLGLAGFAGLALLVSHVGPARVFRALRHALVWLPAFLAVEGARLATEVETTRGLYARLGEPPPRRAVMRAQILAYWVYVLSPMGRAAAELTKATILSSRVSSDRAAAVAAVAQGAALLGTTTVSVLCAIAATLRPDAWPLATAVWLQTGAVAVVGGLFLWGIRRPVVGRGMERVLERIGLAEERRVGFGPCLRRFPAIPWRATLGYAAARGLEVLLFGLLLRALGVGAGPLEALRAMGAGLLGAAAVDLVPADVGLTEGAFALFHDAIGVDLAVGVSVGLLFHATQLIWIAISASAALAWRDDV